ncbi:MAG: amino acid adenylation domain-containing protein, partial [Ferruginibacter sp.]
AGHLQQQQTGLLLPSIEVMPRPEHIPLSFSQERLWFIDQLEGSVQYHLPTVLKLQGKLNRQALAYALQAVVDRHEALRSVICNDQDETYQQVIPATNWELLITDGSVYENNSEGLEECIRNIINAPFDLSKDYMLRADLVALKKDEHVLVATMHHIASDGWSLPIIVNEVAELYASYVEGRDALLVPLKIQYADFAIWQRNYLQGAVLENKLQYWKEKLNAVSPLQLPTDFVRHTIQSMEGASVAFTIDSKLTDQVHVLCQKQKTTLFMALLTVFKVLLYRYSDQQDICVGTPIAGRQQVELEALVGFFVNTIALRTELNEGDSFVSLLQKVKQTTLDAYEHQQAPFEKIVELVVKERDLSRSPLFQVMFVLQNIPDSSELNLPELVLTGGEMKNNTSKYDISFYITETADGIRGTVEYCTDLYKEATIIKMIDHYKQLLTNVLNSPGQNIAVLPMLGKKEQHQLLIEFNNTAVAYPGDKNIVSFFEQQVLKTPAATAVYFGEEYITYQQLNEGANQFAHYLKSRDVQAGQLLPVCMPRSIELITGILGILKTGCVYVPIDSDYPAERIGYMLKDTAAKFFVTNQNFDITPIDHKEYEVVCVDQYDKTDQSTTNPINNLNAEDLACVIYTSGSSGRPKGVKLMHAGIANRFQWMWTTYPFEANETNAIKTSIGFGDHIWELFGPLCKGVPSVIFSKEQLTDLDVLINKLAGHRITRWVLVPSLLRTLLNKLQEDQLSLPHLKYWTSSGETLSAELVADFYKVFPASDHKLLNIYGSSEVTADVTYCDTSVTEYNKTGLHQHIPIGKPISNTRLYILDKRQQLVAAGVVGEICIGGVPVANGYLNLPELTSQRFVQDLFSETPGALMFRTGDFGRWLEDGNIEYLGRIDDQVKIRGNRVELGEIETALLQAGIVQQCVVLAKKDSSGTNNLVGYVVANETIDKLAMSAFLKERLPEYMVPYVWVQLECFPLTSSGKIDKKHLPAPGEKDVLSNIYVAPTTELEQGLVTIWAQLLAKERIGILDNFFELGGHSLLAMRVVSSIRKELGVELAIKDLFTNASVASLAGLLQKQSRQLLPAIEVMARPEYIPLSFSQERLWFIDSLEGSSQYHLPMVLNLRGDLNKDALLNALQIIIDRHEVLRTVIRQHEGNACQTIKSKGTWQLPLEEATQYHTDSTGLKAYIESLVKAPFDLSADYPVRG